MYTDSKKKIDFWSLLAGIIFVILGVVVVCRPYNALRAIIVVIGIIALCLGVYHIILHTQLEKDLGINGFQYYIDAVVDILIGLLLIFSESFGFVLIAIALALWFIIDSIANIYKTNKANKVEKKPYRYLTLACDILGIILGIILFFTPMISVSLAVLLIAIYFIVEGIKMIVRSF